MKRARSGAGGSEPLTTDAPVLSLRAAAGLLGLHENTVRALAVEGSLPACKIGRSWRFLRADLISCIRSGYRGAQAASTYAAVLKGEGAGSERPSSAEAAERELDQLLSSAPARRRGR